MISSRLDLYTLYPDKDIYYPISTKEVTKTEQIDIYPDNQLNKLICEILSYFCHISKNVYNEANYEAIQEY